MKAVKLGSVLALAVLALGLTACGSSDSKDSGLSKSDLISKANAICKRGTKEGTAIKPPASLNDAAVAAAYFDKVEAVTKKETADLKALKPASDVKADYNAFTTAQQTAEDLVEQITAKAHAKDASGQADIAKLGPLGKKVNAAAKKLGANDCTK
jgi:hypothetical protein